jgi:cell wall-associated NlpC family hydrolase
MNKLLPDWVKKYVGIPFVEYGRDASGCDCWGLLCLVSLNEFDIRVPLFAGETWSSNRDTKKIARLMLANAGDWVEVPPGEEQCGDGVWLTMCGVPSHVGVVVARGMMLHLERGCDAVVERYDSILWRNKIKGFYRYAPTGA